MNKKINILFGLSFILAAIMFVVIWYGLTSIVELKKEENTLRGEMQSWIKRSKQTASLQNTLTEAKNVKEDMQEYYFDPTEENQIMFISDLEKIIKETKSTGEVRSLDVSPDNTKVVGSINVYGEWNDVYHTLLALETYPIKLKFDDVSISEDNTVDPSLSASKEKRQKYRAIVRFTIINIQKNK